MELRHLRYFLAVAKEENITRAAEALNLTQPTLSRQLADLEEELGIKLFDRGSKKITLTNDGLLLKRRAEEIFDLVSKTEMELKESEETVEGTISIGCGDLKALNLFPEIIKTFRAKYPRVTFDFYTAIADDIKYRLDKGLVDIAIFLEPVDLSKYEFIRLSSFEEWMIGIPANSELAKKESIEANDLKDKMLILPSRENVRTEIASWFKKGFKDLDIIITSNLPSTSSIFVANSLAYSVVLASSVNLFDDKKIVFKPLNPPLLASSVIAWKRDEPRAIASQKFVEHLKEALSFPE